MSAAVLSDGSWRLRSRDDAADIPRLIGEAVAVRFRIAGLIEEATDATLRALLPELRAVLLALAAPAERIIAAVTVTLANNLTGPGGLLRRSFAREAREAVTRPIALAVPILRREIQGFLPEAGGEEENEEQRRGDAEESHGEEGEGILNRFAGGSLRAGAESASPAALRHD